MTYLVDASRAGDKMSTDDRIIVKTPDRPGFYFSDLSLHVGSPDIRKSIITYIGNFGDLYHGYIRKDVWLHKFHETKKHLLDIMLWDHHEIDTKHDIGFKLMLIHDLISNGKWNFPSIMEIRNHALSWINGHSRLLASGINWADPWNQMRFIIFVPKGNCVHTDWFDRLEKITDDSMLRKILNENISDDRPCIINAGFVPVDDAINFQIMRFEFSTKEHDRDPVKIFDRWQQWKTLRDRGRIPVEIYTDWPDAISDSSRTWEIQHAGTSVRGLIYHSNLSSRIHVEKLMDQTQPAIFRVYQFDPEKIDLAELFFWMDTDHSVYHTRDWSTVFVQTGIFKCKEISFSRL